MIKYIKRADLDVEKYNACLDNSTNARIYAYSWYLDIVSDNWDVLILGDYKAVMPLPWRQKYLIKYIYKPCWTQQLGVFSTDTIDENLVREFIKAIPRKFKKITIQFNSDNPISGKGISKKINYILGLKKTYKELFLGYKSVRRRNKRQSVKNHIEIEQTDDVVNVIELFKSKKQDVVAVKDSDYSKLENLIFYLLKKKKAEVLITKDTKNNLLGGAFFLIDKHRITYLFSAVTDDGRQQNTMSYIIDCMIEKHANSNYTLDFEGSMIDGIAFFFRSFGAKDEGYYLWEESLLN